MKPFLARFSERLDPSIESSLCGTLTNQAGEGSDPAPVSSTMKTITKAKEDHDAFEGAWEVGVV
jgi:hypothetical protein